MEVATTLPALRVIRVLEMLRETHGALPKTIRTDCISNPLQQWCHKPNIEIAYIQPGKPNQNAYIERCNRTLREELLNCWAFESLPEVRWFVEKLMYDYNHLRPHNALRQLTPIQLLNQSA
jgi:putative transposase